MQPCRNDLQIERARRPDGSVVVRSASEGGLYRDASHDPARHADRHDSKLALTRLRSRHMRSRRGPSCYGRSTMLRLVCDVSFDTPNGRAAATYYGTRRNVGPTAVFDASGAARPPGVPIDEEFGACVGRRVYWSGGARQPRREGTVVAAYCEPRGGSAPAVIVIDVRWDPPPADQRPRGPLSLGIPVARIGTPGWGWVDGLPSSPSARALPNAAFTPRDQLGQALRERFGIAVRRIRKSQGLSQERLALACGLHRTFVGAVERGETNVSLATLDRLAKGLGVSVAHLAAEAESAYA